MASSYCPGRAGEGGAPVVGLLSVFALPPDVEVPLGVLLGLAALHKPGMLVGGVVDHQVHDDFQSPGVGLGQQAVEVGHGAELLHDGLVVADVVAVVVIGGAVHRGEPDNVDAQLLDVVQLAGDAGQIADAVSVGIAEAAGVNLVDDALFPPCLVHDKDLPYTASM